MDEKNELKEKIALVAQILNFPQFQFELSVRGDKSLQESIMSHDIEFYKSTAERLKDLSPLEKRFERGKLQRPILGKTESQVQEMAEKIEDRYSK